MWCFRRCGRLALLRLILYTSLLCAVFYSYSRYSAVYHATQQTHRKLERLKANGSKIILFYTTLFGESKWYWNISSPENYPYKCTWTYDKAALHQADAVVFHGVSSDIVRANRLLKKPRPPKLYDQLWVFHLKESPDSLPDSTLSNYENVFNWTVTYRKDADIWAPYGQFKPKGQALRRPLPLTLDLTTEALARKKISFAMISNCNANSDRLQYINLMKKYIPVDFYGKCGTKKCRRTKNCYKELANKYKFFLAFENSFCTDYITEKAFRSLQFGIVPVVRGGANYSSILPPNSYVNVNDFRTVRDLTEYLLHLHENNYEFREYFKWRTDFEMDSIGELELCKKLHDFDIKMDERKSYKHIKDWHLTNYTGESLCWESNTPQ